ncbi:hypothetical protein [Pseudomonas aeruginosa]|uniref:hypothetical protein n=1 Tax=Pseudomonas aeruginosa TaxID=287 RepID=UPI0024C3500F|nr:hypothetical protein [Pseudomonas aeruginosa]
MSLPSWAGGSIAGFVEEASARDSSFSIAIPHAQALFYTNAIAVKNQLFRRFGR